MIGMSKRQAPGSSLKGAELFKAIYTLQELKRLFLGEEAEEAAEEGVKVSQGLAVKVISEKIIDLLVTLRVKAEGPLVGSAELTLLLNLKRMNNGRKKTTYT